MADPRDRFADARTPGIVVGYSPNALAEEGASPTSDIGAGLPVNALAGGEPPKPGLLANIFRDLKSLGAGTEKRPPSAFDAHLARLQEQLDAANDGGDLSGPSANRIPGEQGRLRNNTVLPTHLAGQQQFWRPGSSSPEAIEPEDYVAGIEAAKRPSNFEDPEAAAWRERLQPPSLLRRAAESYFAPSTAIYQMGKGILEAGYAGAKGLLDEPYNPNSDDEDAKKLAVQRAFDVASLVGTGSLAGIRPSDSLGTFVGRQWAEGRAKAGKTTGRDVLDMAETMEQNGLPDDFIRSTGKDMIAKGNDRVLGDFFRGDDGEWRLEVSDRYMTYGRTGAPLSTIGSAVRHPDLFEGLPELANTKLRRVPRDYGGKFRPGHPEYGIPSSIEVGQSSPSRRSTAAHEINHDAGFQEGFARGGGPALFEEGGQLAHLRKPGESPHDAYLRMVGERDSALTEARLNMSAKQRREISVEETMADPRFQRVFPPGDPIVAFYRDGGKPMRRPANDDALSTRRNPLDPDGAASAFDQAQEGHWGDLTQRSPLSDQLDWNEAAAGRGKKPLPPQGYTQRESDRLTTAVREYEAELSGKSSEQIASALEKRFGFPVDRDLLAKKGEWWHLPETIKGDLPAVDKSKAPAAPRVGAITDEVREQINALVRGGVKPADVAKSIDAYVKPEVVERVATAAAEQLAKRERLSRYLSPQERIYAAPEFDGMRTPEVASILSERLGKTVKAEHVQQSRSRAKELGIEINVPMGAPTKPSAPRLYFRKAAPGKYTDGKWVILDAGKEYKTGAGPKDVDAAESALAAHIKSKKDGTLKSAGVPVNDDDGHDGGKSSLWDRINFWGGY